MDKDIKESQLSREDKNRIKEVFSDPIKILILFKILKTPEITSKELKREINISTTKIYYYIEDLEGVKRIKKMKDGKRIYIKESVKEPIIKSITELTKNQLRRKRYELSPFGIRILQKNVIFSIFDLAEENMKWRYLVGLNIAIALITLHKREIEEVDPQKFIKESNLLNIIHANNLAFVSPDTFNKTKNKIKTIFDEICETDDQNVLLNSIKDRSHVIILGAMNW